MKVIHSKDVPEELSKKYEDMVKADDADTSSVHHEPASDEETKQLNNAVHGDCRTKAISIKMPGELLDELKTLARRDHIGYQTYIKFILSQHVRKMRQEGLVSGSDTESIL